MRRVCKLVSAVWIGGAGACSPFAAEPQPSPISEPDAGGDASTGSDAGADADVDGSSGPSFCAKAPLPWALCLDFDTEPAWPTPWREVGGGDSTVTLAPSTEQSHSSPRSLEARSLSPNAGDSRYYEASVTGDASGIACQVAFRPAELPAGATRVLWLRFATDGASDYGYGAASLYVARPSGGAHAFVRTEAVHREGGAGQPSPASATVPLTNAWSVLEISVDLAQAVARVGLQGSSPVSVSIPDLRPLTSTTVRVGLGATPPTGQTTFYVDDLGCRVSQ